MSYQPIDRAKVERAGDLDFDRAPAEKQANIAIEVAPDGIHVRCEYTGTLGSIPAAIERLKAAGVLELVNASRPPRPAWTGGKPKIPRVQPAYDGNGDPMCPVHRRTLKTGTYGLYCSAKTKEGEQANANGYCAIRFADQ